MGVGRTVACAALAVLTGLGGGGAARAAAQRVPLSVPARTFALRPSDLPRGFVWHEAFEWGVRNTYQTDITWQGRYPSPYAGAIHLLVAVTTVAGADAAIGGYPAPGRRPWDPAGVGDRERGYKVGTLLFRRANVLVLFQFTRANPNWEGYVVRIVDARIKRYLTAH